MMNGRLRQRGLVAIMERKLKGMMLYGNGFVRLIKKISCFVSLSAAEHRGERFLTRAYDKL